MIWLKDLVGGDHAPVGTFVKIPSVEMLEILKRAGFDFTIIDFEHSPLTLSDLNVMIALSRAIDLPALVRVPDHGYGDVQRILDAGAAGLLFPHVSTKAQCEQVISQASHPPRGTRGAGANMRAGDWAMPGGTADYVGDAANKVMLLPMIEEKTAVDNTAEIVSVDGVDAIFIGPGDLAMSMGLPFGHPDVKVAVDQAFTTAKQAGVPVAGVTGDGTGARKMIEAGYDLVLIGSDIGMYSKIASTNILDLRG